VGAGLNALVSSEDLPAAEEHLRRVANWSRRAADHRAPKGKASVVARPRGARTRQYRRLHPAFDRHHEQKREAQFAQSQKMASASLAGGIAHDFNNLLTAMIGFCDLPLLRHRAGDQSFADIMQIKQNANRAANLVRQLLASRQ
jgi:two-component system cell cycle sensor histidine kinase/response regulator CckA